MCILYILYIDIKIYVFTVGMYIYTHTQICKQMFFVIAEKYGSYFVTPELKCNGNPQSISHPNHSLPPTLFFSSSTLLSPPSLPPYLPPITPSLFSSLSLSCSRTRMTCWLHQQSVLVMMRTWRSVSQEMVSPLWGFPASK